MQRWAALDRLRALSVVLMIQGHTFTALLKPGEFSSTFSQLHALLHGLTGPAFLLGAGLAFAVTTYPQFERYHRPGPALWARLRRYLLILALGYALQLPGGSVWGALRASGETLRLVARVGPLQLIALTLAFVQLSVLVFKRPRSHALGMALLAAGVLLAAPRLYVADLGQGLHPLLAAFLDDRQGSQYPLVPNAAMPLLGAALGMLCIRYAPVLLRTRALALLGLIVAGALYAAFQAGLLPYDRTLFWRVSPAFVLFRTALTVLALGLLHSAETRPSQPGKATLTAALARHSLIAYVAHLLLLYGTPITPNIASRYAASLTLTECCLVTAAVLLLTLAIVRAVSEGGPRRALTYAAEILFLRQARSPYAKPVDP